MAHQITNFPPATHAWTQETLMGEIYIETTDVGVSRLDFEVPDDAKNLGRDEDIATAIDAYFEKPFGAFDEVKLDLSTLTPFRREVVELLMSIPTGTTVSYGELAVKVGRPNGPRAVGQAVGSNPVPLIAPCHRVLAANRKIGGYSGGLDRKRWLLDYEGIETT